MLSVRQFCQDARSLVLKALQSIHSCCRGSLWHSSQCCITLSGSVPVYSPLSPPFLHASSLVRFLPFCLRISFTLWSGLVSKCLSPCLIHSLSLVQPLPFCHISASFSISLVCLSLSLLYVHVRLSSILFLTIGLSCFNLCLHLCFSLCVRLSCLQSFFLFLSRQVDRVGLDIYMKCDTPCCV